MISDDLEDLIKTRLPLKIQQRLLFLDKWEEPYGFTEWKVEDREKLYTQLAPKSTKPTRANFWVWFGAYGVYDHYPRFSKNRVNRIIYECLHGPLGKNRLVNSFTETYSDVNPFKFMKATGHRYRGHDDLRQSLGQNYDLSKVMSTRQYERKVLEAMETINSCIQMDFNDYRYPEEMVDCLMQLGHSKVIALGAIQRSDLMKGPLHASHPNHPEHPNNKVEDYEIEEETGEEDQEPAPQTGLVSDDPREPELD